VLTLAQLKPSHVIAQLRAHFKSPFASPR